MKLFEGEERAPRGLAGFEVLDLPAFQRCVLFSAKKIDKFTKN